MPIFTQEDLRKQAERDAARNVGQTTESMLKIIGSPSPQTGTQPTVSQPAPFSFAGSGAGVAGTAVVGAPMAPQPTLAATDQEPVKTIGPTTEPGKQLTINDVLFKQSRGEQLNREEFDFATNFLMKQQEDQRQALIRAEQEKIKAAQAFAPQAEQFATERAKTAEERFQQELSAGTTAIHQKFQPLFTGVEEAGKKQREAQQSIFSFSGFGRSTDAATKAGEIEAATSNALQKLEAARQAETAALRASLSGEKASTVNALNANVEKLKSEAKAIETEALAQIQELNAKSQASGVEAINNIMQVLGKTSPEEAAKVDEGVSELFGFAVDSYGKEVLVGGKRVPLKAKEKEVKEPTLPAIAQEYNFAKEQGFTGSFMEYQQQKEGGFGTKAAKGAGRVTGAAVGGAVPRGASTDPAQRDADSVVDGVLNLQDISTKGNYRAEVAAELAKRSKKSLESGDLYGAMRASAAYDKEPSDTFLTSMEKTINVASQIGVLQNSITGTQTGPIIGAFRGVNPWDTNAQVIKAQLNAIIPNLARGVFGEVGVLTDNDIKQYSKTLPTLTSTEAIRNGILYITIDQIRKSVDAKIKNQAAGQRDMSGYADIYKDMTSLVNEIKATIPGTAAPAAVKPPSAEVESAKNKYGLTY